jgi:hypothetical protein
MIPFFFVNELYSVCERALKLFEIRWQPATLIRPV